MSLSAEFTTNDDTTTIRVTTTSGNIVAESNPEPDTEPMQALEDLGFRLTFPSQDLLFGQTLAGTTDKKVHVTPINRSA